MDETPTGRPHETASGDGSSSFSLRAESDFEFRIRVNSRWILGAFFLVMLSFWTVIAIGILLRRTNLFNALLGLAAFSVILALTAWGY
jgi:hypothetical protein